MAITRKNSKTNKRNKRVSKNTKKTSKRSNSSKRNGSKNRKVRKTRKSVKGVRKMKGGEESIEKIVENYSDIIDALYQNKPIPSTKIPNNLCENKQKGFYKLKNDTIISNNPENIETLMTSDNIPKELLYCIGPDNKIIGTNYDDILPGQDSISKEIVNYKQIELLDDYKKKGYIEIRFKNCCKDSEKQKPFIPDEHHKFVTAIQLKLPIKLINKENEQVCSNINADMGKCKIGTFKSGFKASISDTNGSMGTARKNWSNFKSLSIEDETWVKNAVTGKCNKILDDNEKNACINTGKLLQKTEYLKLINNNQSKTQVNTNNVESLIKSNENKSANKGINIYGINDDDIYL